MAHVRKQIRDRISSLLSSEVAAVSGRVFTSRVYPLSEEKMPCISVNTNSENASIMTMGLKTYDRSCEVNVDLYVSAKDTYAEDIDDLLVSILEAIALDTALQSLVKTVFPSGKEIEFSGDTHTPVAICRLTFIARYVTSLQDVETAR